MSTLDVRAPARVMVPSEEVSGDRASPGATDGSGRRWTSRYHLTPTPALDGVRGVAMLGVLFFHLGHLGGGFLGVNLFFSLSGFLITTLLLEERLRDGRVRLKNFWLRRARRLLPALFGLVVGVGLYALLIAPPGELERIRGDMLATVFYVANWHAIFGGQEYWDLFASPSILQHTWTLAIEEQFYLVWPAILGTLLWWRRGSLRAVLAFCLALGVALTLWMAVAFDPANLSRTYEGTDTRLPALLFGAALAAWLQWHGPVRSLFARVSLEVAAVLGGGLLLVLWTLASGSDARLYRGGFLLCDLAGVALIAAAAHPTRGPVARALAIRPVRFIGLISYGLYLWHWPVIVVLNPARTGLDGLALSAVQAAVGIALGTISYYLIEQPIRRDGWKAWRVRPLVPIAGVLAIVFALVCTSLPKTATAEQAAAQHLVEASDQDAVVARASATLVRNTDDPIARQQPDAVRPGQPLPRPDGRLPRMMILGDSVGLSLGMSMDQDKARWRVDQVNRSIVGCTLDSTSGTTRNAAGAVRHEHPACQQWPTRYAEDVKQYRPDAVLVAFGGLQTDARQLDGGWYRPCDDHFKQWFRGEWDRALQVLSSEGAIVYVAPAAYVDLPTIYPDINDGFDCINPVIRDAVAANPAARLLPLDTWVCPTRAQCRDQEGDHRLRFDGIHYAGPGADEANTWIQSQLFAP